MSNTAKINSIKKDVKSTVYREASLSVTKGWLKEHNSKKLGSLSG